MRVDGTISAEGLEFAYREWGEGRPVLLLHGFPDSPGSWEGVAERLAAAGYRAVAPWLRGYGPTGGGALTSMGQLGRDVVGMAKALGDGPIPLITHDWGAAAGCIAATMRPDAFSHLVTMGLPHPAYFLARTFADPEQLRRSWYMWFFQFPELPESALEAEDYAMVDKLWRDWSPGLAENPNRAELIETFTTGGLEGPLSYYRTVFSDADSSDPDDGALYGPVATPTLSLMGADDGCITASYLEGQEQYWEAPLTSQAVPDCGHFLQVERPDEIARRILEFIGQA